MRLTLIVVMSALATAAVAQVVSGPSARFINPSGLRASTGYTHVVEATGGRTVSIAGQVAIDAEGNLVGPGDFRVQARQVFDNLQTALTSVGAGFEHLVKTNIYVTDMSQLDGLRQIRAEFMPPPTSTLVQVVRLAREEFLLEIEAIAVLPD